MIISKNSLINYVKEQMNMFKVNFLTQQKKCKHSKEELSRLFKISICYDKLISAWFDKLKYQH